jgi:hypothetical protein
LQEIFPFAVAVPLMQGFLWEEMIWLQTFMKNDDP